MAIARHFSIVSNIISYNHKPAFQWRLVYLFLLELLLAQNVILMLSIQVYL